MNWQTIVEELEEATARLIGVADSDLMGFTEALRRRSAVIERLHGYSQSPPAPIPVGLLDRIRQDFKNGTDAQEKLLLVRADTRAELTRMAESSYLMRSLARPAAGRAWWLARL